MKNPPAMQERGKRGGFDPWVGKIPGRREWLPTPAFLPGESQGQRNLAGFSPWGHKMSDTTERLTLIYLDIFLVCLLGGSSSFENVRDLS